MCKYKIAFNNENVEFQNTKFYYTEIAKVLTAGRIAISQYNWLIVDVECNYYPNDEWEKNRCEYIWLSGKEFSEILDSHQQIQIIWGTIVAYESEIEFDKIREVDLPQIDISKIDIANIKMQSKLGILELVSIDSSEFSVVSKVKMYIDNLRENISVLNN